MRPFVTLTLLLAAALAHSSEWPHYGGDAGGRHYSSAAAINRSNVADLDGFVAKTAGDTTWAVCCFGATEHAAVTASAGVGGHARVGFENNLLLPDGSVADDNAALVRLAVDAGREAGREPASAADVRKQFR